MKDLKDAVVADLLKRIQKLEAKVAELEKSRVERIPYVWASKEEMEKLNGTTYRWERGSAPIPNPNGTDPSSIT